MSDEAGCVKCGRELERAATGRPKRYCGTPCRRAAEFELRRIQRQIEDLEHMERTWRQELNPATARLGASKGYAEGQHGFYAAEIARMETRLRSLLDD
ncbi:MAG: hypothetical protein ABR529_03470 [Actinomycetota bacterium]